MCRYYILDPEADPSVIGVDNFDVQAHIDRSTFKNKKNFDYLVKCLGSNYFWENSVEAKKLELNVENVCLAYKAIATDFMRFSPGLMNTYFLVSEKIKKTVAGFKNQDVVFFDTVIYLDSEILQYSLMYVESLSKDNIDYKASIFTTGDEFTGESVVKIDSYEDELKLKKTDYEISPKVIKLRDNSHSNKDIFKFGARVFISHRLKSAIEEKGSSGVTFLPAYGESANHIKIE